MMKHLLNSFTGLLIITFCVNSYGQEVYTVTESEYEQIKSSPEKLEEIKSSGFEIKLVREETAKDPDPEVARITESELAEYQRDVVKFDQWIKENGGDYVVTPDQFPTENQASATPSSQDVEKLRLEEQLTRQSHQNESFVPMRERSGDDTSDEQADKSVQSEDHGSGMGGNSSDRMPSAQLSEQQITSKLSKVERDEANRKFDSVVPN